MPKVVRLSEADEAWLHANHHHLSPRQMADRIGVCVDTLKRILVRRGLANFEGAKYVATDRRAKWTRPCIGCRCTKPRPRGLYFCDPCRMKRIWD